MYITLTGFDYHAGSDFLEKDMILFLKKDPKNSYDDEAIRVLSETGATVAHVANSVRTVIRGTHSAGYVYNFFGVEGRCIVKFFNDKMAIAEIIEDDEVTELE